MINKDREWYFWGLYGDSSPRTIYIETLPNDLPANLKETLMHLYTREYERRESELHIKEFRELYVLGLIRENGNAWNKSIIWPTMVNDWMKGQDQTAHS